MNQVPTSWYYYPIIALFSAILMWSTAFIICSFQGISISSLNWLVADAQHYESVKNTGYESPFLAAFFPLFPFLWRLTGLSAIGIGLVNGALFITSAGLLGQTFKLPLRYFMLYCSLPLNVFYFLPYSESIFAFAMVLLLIGIFKWNWWQMIIGVVMCSFCRPTAALLVPALLLATCLLKEKTGIKRKLLVLPLAASMAFFGVLLLQSMETGSLITFFEAQRGWGSFWRLPKFPLTSWGNAFNLSLDVLSLFISTMCGLGFVMALKKKLKLSFIEWFSIAFIGGTGLLVVLTRGGELYSLSRFVYCIPAFPFAMAVLFRESLIPRKALIGILFFFPWLFGIHVHIQAALTASLLSAIVAGSILFWSSNTTWKSTLVIAMLAVLQAYCCSLFLQGHWLG